MKRHSSNKVKMLKMAASATKQTMKVNASERKSVASIRFGKPNLEWPPFDICCFVAEGSDDFVSLDMNDPDDVKGTRFTSKNNKLKPKSNTVPSHGPMYGDMLPARAIDSPSSDAR